MFLSLEHFIQNHPNVDNLEYIKKFTNLKNNSRLTHIVPYNYSLLWLGSDGLPPKLVFPAVFHSKGKFGKYGLYFNILNLQNIKVSQCAPPSPFPNGSLKMLVWTHWRKFRPSSSSSHWKMTFLTLIFLKPLWKPHLELCIYYLLLATILNINETKVPVI